jgi:hypothetical protein
MKNREEKVERLTITGGYACPMTYGSLYLPCPVAHLSRTVTPRTTREGTRHRIIISGWHRAGVPILAGFVLKEDFIIPCQQLSMLKSLRKSKYHS